MYYNGCMDCSRNIAQMSVLSAMVDDLLGYNRNEDGDSQLHWSDEKVCKYFLCGFCPHDLFTNTKADLGPCENLHDPKLRISYDESSRRGTMRYEREYLVMLEGMILDLTRKLKRGVERLDKSYHGANEENDENVKLLSDQITELLKETEKFGSEGRLDEAQELMSKVEQLKKDKVVLLTQIAGKNPNDPNALLMNEPERRLELCQVCGAFLIVNDTPRRINDHMSGKMHIGYAKIRNAVDELKASLYGDIELSGSSKNKSPKDEKVPRSEERSSKKRSRESGSDSPDRVKHRNRTHSYEGHRSRESREEKPKSSRSHSKHKRSSRGEHKGRSKERRQRDDRRSRSRSRSGSESRSKSRKRRH